MSNQLSGARLFCFGLVLCALIGGVASAFLLMYRGPYIWLPFALALPAAILHTGAAFLVWNGLSGFKAELRKAYLFICIAVVFVGFTQLQLPVISIFGWWELRENGVILVPFVLPFIFFFIGIRRFTRLLNIRTFWASPWLVNAIGLALGIGMTFVPHAPNSIDAKTFDGTLILLSWIAIHALALTNMVLRIKLVIGTRYANAMAWLFITYVSVLLTTLAYMGTLLIASPGDWYLDYNISVAPFIIVGLLWVRAGYAFNAVTAGQVATSPLGSFFGPTKHTNSPFPSVDIIIYAAGQASNPQSIDPILDDLRLVTANNQPGTILPGDQQSLLAKVYLQIESHLIHQDQLREFTRAGMRDDIEQTFSVNELNNSFWPLIQQPVSPQPTQLVPAAQV